MEYMDLIIAVICKMIFFIEVWLESHFIFQTDDPKDIIGEYHT